MVRSIPTPPPETSHTRDRIVNALEMGTCDGEYYTDHQIRQAFNELPADGGAIYLPEGTWEIHKPIVWTKHNCILYGAGVRTILRLVDGADCDMITMPVTRQHCVIRDMKLDGNIANNAAGSCIDMTNGVNNRVQNVHCFDAADEALHAHAAGGAGTTLQLDQVWANGSGAEGILVTGYEMLSITNCISSLMASGADSRYHIASVRYATLINNWAEGSFGDGYHFDDLEYFNILTCMCMNGETNGMNFDDTTDICRRGSVSSCRTGVSGVNGLLLAATSEDITFNGCDFDTTISYAGTRIIFENVKRTGNRERTRNAGSSTGTGAQQTIAHGLITTPTHVKLWDIETGAAPYQSAAADAANIYVLSVLNQDWGWEAEIDYT